MAFDISAVGAKIVFSNPNLTIDEFSDEGTPFECPDIDVSTNAKNLNGEMISSRTPSVYQFSITVIPGSAADVTMRDWLAKSAIQPGNNNATDAFYIGQCEISLPQVYSPDGGAFSTNNSVTFSNIRIKSGPPGPSTSAEGRMSARTYTFEAEKFSR